VTDIFNIIKKKKKKKKNRCTINLGSLFKSNIFSFKIEATCLVELLFLEDTYWTILGNCRLEIYGNGGKDNHGMIKKNKK